MNIHFSRLTSVLIEHMAKGMFTYLEVTGDGRLPSNNMGFLFMLIRWTNHVIHPVYSELIPSEL